MTFKYKDLVVDLSGANPEGDRGWLAVIGCGSLSVELSCTSTQRPPRRREPIDFMTGLKNSKDYAALQVALGELNNQVEVLRKAALAREGGTKPRDEDSEDGGEQPEPTA